jgi:hypothetical protein
MEHIKPVALSEKASKPQGEPLGLRVKERRESERRSVMGWIGIETLSHSKEGRLLLGPKWQGNLRNLQRR